MGKLLSIFRVVLYWALPPVLLYLIFRQLDLARLASLGAAANPWLACLGASLVVPKICAGALRWHHLARSLDCIRFTFGRSLREYWFSAALGMFTPGSLGSDAYRVALGGKQTGRYLRGAFVIGVEKSAALLSCVSLIAALYPFLATSRADGEFRFLIEAAQLAALLGLGLLAAAGIAHRSRWARNLANALWQRIRRLAHQAVAAAPGRLAEVDAARARPQELLQALLRPRVALPTIGLSLAIHVIGALQGQLFVQALGYDLPFLVNLFIAPLAVLVLTLPITVGGIGVREGVYILFYGAFGVPAETALLISFCSLLTVMAGNAVGGLAFLTQSRCPAGRSA